MASKGYPTAQKRARERARQEKQQAKAQRRLERKQEKADRPEGVPAFEMGEPQESLLDEDDSENA